jgi:hypothetical protein
MIQALQAQRRNISFIEIDFRGHVDFNAIRHSESNSSSPSNSLFSFQGNTFKVNHEKFMRIVFAPIFYVTLIILNI